jgi:hypothetical protein
LTERLSDSQEFWAEQFDLSALSYPQFLAFFFNRPIVGEKEQYDLFRAGIDYFIALNPTTVVAHVQAMCRTFPELTEVYSLEQLDQGLWAVFGAAINCERFLFDPAVESRLRIECIESMYLPFRDVVAGSVIGKHGSFYWMWWDMILHTFWQQADGYAFNYPALSDDRKQMLEAMFQTLLKTLGLDHPACQWSALHGLGHLNHPRSRETVQNYLDVHRHELNDQDLRWVESCRDGRIA